jgi:hypothetical protein
MAERMTDEQIAEVRAAALRAMEHLEGDGSSTETCVQAMPYLLDEIEMAAYAPDERDPDRIEQSAREAVDEAVAHLGGWA